MTTLDEVVALSDDELSTKLKNLIEEVSILRGDFTLKSGLSSSWFIDGKKIVCHPTGVLYSAVALIRLIERTAAGLSISWPDAIGGLTMGADPVSFTTASIACALGKPIRSFSVRKETKDHGGGGKIAGWLEEGDFVVVTEDVVSRGVSLVQAVDSIAEAGGSILFATAIVDRGGSVGRLLAEKSIPFIPMFTALDFGLPFEGGMA